jgi:hypothetical protein
MLESCSKTKSDVEQTAVLKFNAGSLIAPRKERISLDCFREQGYDTLLLKQKVSGLAYVFEGCNTCRKLKYNIHSEEGERKGYQKKKKKKTIRPRGGYNFFLISKVYSNGVKGRDP